MENVGIILNWHFFWGIRQIHPLNTTVNICRSTVVKYSGRGITEVNWVMTDSVLLSDTGLHLKNTAAEIDGLRLLRICLHSPNIYTCKLITRCVFWKYLRKQF